MFQADLLKTLDDFNVLRPEDYYRLPPGRRAYFIRHLYKAFTENKESVFRDIAQSGGLKVHFATSGDLTNDVTNVPSEAFLKKMCFYANRTLISFPFKEIHRAELSRALKGIPIENRKKSLLKQNRPILFGDIYTERTPRGGIVTLQSGGGYSLDPAAFRDFLTIVGQLRPAIDAGLTYLMPAFPDEKQQYRRIASRLTSANFQLEELKRQFQEEELMDAKNIRFQGDLLNLYLPYFTNIPLERLLEIRNREQDMYNIFQRYLESVTGGISQADGEERLLSTLKDIDKGIRDLERKFRSTCSEYSRRNIYIGVGVICAGLAVLAGVQFGKEAAGAIASVAGAATGIQFVSSKNEYAKSRENLADDKFYMPWLVYREMPSLIERTADNNIV